MPKNILKILIIVIIIIMILVGVIGTILFVTTDALKPKEELFQKYISQTLDEIFNQLDLSEEVGYINLLKQNDYLKKSEGKLNYLENSNDEQETYQIKSAAISKKADKAFYRKSIMKYGEETLLETEILKENDTIGLRLSNLVQQFISIQNKTLPYFVKNLGLDDTYISETLQNVDFSDVLILSDAEKTKLINDYVQVILNGFNKAYFSSSNDAYITLKNGQSPTTKSYTLTLTESDLDKIYKRVLNHSVEDEIILQKISQIEMKLKQAGINVNEGEIKDKYVKYLTELSEKIEYTGEKNGKITVTVYQLEGKTIRTEIKDDTQKIIIDTQENGLILDIEKVTEQGTDTKTFSLTKESIDGEFKRNFICDLNTTKMEFSFGYKVQENNIESNTNMNYSSTEYANINYQNSSTIALGTEQAVPIQFDDNNNIILNNYEGEPILAIFANLQDRISNSLKESQSKLHIKLLKRIVDLIENREESEKQEQTTINNEKIQEFNNQFILYEGENLNFEHMQRLLNAVSKNMSDYKIVDGNKIRIIIEEGKENEAKFKKVNEAIVEKYTYNVEIKYDENKKINAIDIYRYDKPE